MGWSGQEDGMDVMKEIIQKEIQSISSLEERVIFKNLMEGVFLSLYDTNREMYEGLERRIKEELDYDKNRYYVKTGIVEREFFDASHHLLSPMDESDLAEKLYDMKEILRAVEEEGAFRLMKVMLRCDFLEQQKDRRTGEGMEGGDPSAGKSGVSEKNRIPVSVVYQKRHTLADRQCTLSV